MPDPLDDEPTSPITPQPHPRSAEPLVATGFRRVVTELSRSAWLQLEHLFGDGRSVFDPDTQCWTPDTGRELHSAIMDNLDEGAGTFLEKLQGQLAGRNRALVLLAAELVLLHNLPLSNVKPATKRAQITAVLSWLPVPPTIPEEIERSFDLPGSFNGGAGYSIYEWQHVVWLADLTTEVRQRPEAERAALASDPWAFRQLLAGLRTDADSPAMRNTLLSLAFPDTFEPVISDDSRRRVRNAFIDGVGTPTGDDPMSVDRDLHTIHRSLYPETPDHYIDWFREPWYSAWKPTTRVDARAWGIRARSGDASPVRDWLDGGFVSLAADQLEDLHEGASRASVRRMVADAYDHWDYIQQQTLSNDVFAFTSRMKVGDVVLVRVGDDAHLGTISGPLELADDHQRLRRAVEWSPEPVPFSELPGTVPDLLGQQRLVTDLTKARDQLAALVGPDSPATAEPEPVPQQVPAPVEAPEDTTPELFLSPATTALADRTTIDMPWLEGFIDLLGRRRQVILYGPPGTGKTYLARAVARHLAPGTTTIVQFHPSYSYEDFFEGFRPTPLEDGGVGFTLTPGPLRQMASDAAQDPTTPYVLLIDEINRGNIAKIFGELYFLLEYRTEHVRLQYSPDDQFTLPENLFIIGTMNTADRSIALVDAAIRRRFAFVEMDPSAPPVQGLLGRWLRAQDEGPLRADLLEALNAKLAPLDPDLRVGPSYLMRPEAATEAGLADIWRYDILPLLEEQLYDRLSPAEIRSAFGLATLLRPLTSAGAPTTAHEGVAAPDMSGDGRSGTEAPAES